MITTTIMSSINVKPTIARRRIASPSCNGELRGTQKPPLRRQKKLPSFQRAVGTLEINLTYLANTSFLLITWSPLVIL